MNNLADPELSKPQHAWVLDTSWTDFNTGLAPNGAGGYAGADETHDGSLNQFYAIYRDKAPSAAVRTDSVAMLLDRSRVRDQASSVARCHSARAETSEVALLGGGLVPVAAAVQRADPHVAKPHRVVVIPSER